MLASDPLAIGNTHPLRYYANQRQTELRGGKSKGEGARQFRRAAPTGSMPP
jgi:hypothetical protein